MKKNYLLFIFFAIVFIGFGFSQNPIYVKGKLIDIYTASPNGPVYPNPVKEGPDDFFDTTIPAEISGREFATSMPENGVGPNQVSGDAGRYVIAAVDNINVTEAGWINLNISFTMRADATPRNTYYLFRLDITETDVWYDIPQQTLGNAPTLLFADQGDVKWVDFNPISGIVVAEKAPSTNLVVDPSICVLPNGNLMALAKGPLPKRQFKSTDGGLTWQGFGPDYIQIRFATPFTHNGVLYMLSSFDPGGAPGIFIRKSLDNGETWEMYNGNNYVLLNGTVLNGALNTPSPVIVSNGRIWRAMGDNGPDDFPNLGLMSAPVDADLMNPSSWTYTNTIERGSSQGRYGGILKPWEPCAVATRDGYPIILSRTNPSNSRNGDSSPMYRSTSENNLTFDQNDVIDFPGAKEKFCIQYDQISDTYWALANPAYIEDIGAGDNIWSSRKTLVLQSSSDLVNWKVEHVIAQGTDSRFHGYQYPYFIIDGNDILAAVRTAAEYEDGEAKRQHDANFLTFNRVKNFRDYLTVDEVVRIRKGWDVIFIDGRNTIEGDLPKLYTTAIGESNEWIQMDLGNGYYAYKKSGTNLVLEGSTTGSEIKLMPFDSNNENQQWHKIKADFRHFFLEKRNATGFVIDGGSSSNGQVLTLQPLVTSNLNQRWEFEVTANDFNAGKPTISFEQPASNANIAVGSNLNVIANASDSNGTITSVDLFLNDVLISSDTEAPFQWDGSDPLLQNMTPGNYTLKAIATDNDGEQVAAVIEFQVGEKPTVSFVQPIQNTRFDIGDTVDVIVNANDSNGTIAKVDLLLDDAFVSTDTEAPFQWGASSPLLQNMAKGVYTLQAIATDNDGQQATTTTTFIVGGDASEISIEVTGNGYTKKTFQNGALLWNNRTYTLEGVPTDFIGFEFLQSAAQVAEGGTITPQADGLVYLIARETEASKLGAGWSVVPNSGFNYRNGTTLTSLVLFQQNATANIPIEIPAATGFTGATPIAKTIQLETLGIDDNTFDTNKSFIVYPNPVKEGSFNIELKGIEKADISIFNLDGRLLYSRKNIGGTINIKTSNIFKTGLYIVKATKESGTVFTKKIVIN